MSSNYGAECDLDNTTGLNQPLYSKSLSGPFVMRAEKELPTRYILTKTHCGGRCNDCDPSKYIETETSFLNMCSKGSLIRAAETGWEKIHVNYDPNLVQRAIHLIRNPFDNVVSNFHLEQHEKKKKRRKKWLDTFTNDIHGFRFWCSFLDQRYLKDEINLFPKTILEKFEKVPCHSFFYKYAQVRMG